RHCDSWFIGLISTNKALSPPILVFLCMQIKWLKMIRQRWDIANSLLAIHQVNLYDCSVKKVKIAVLRGHDSCV
ncbi:hypothetical protein, partial [Klebsiella pasteurii]